jgi:hypothetical protein
MRYSDPIDLEEYFLPEVRTTRNRTIATIPRIILKPKLNLISIKEYRAEMATFSNQGVFKARKPRPLAISYD